MRSVATGHQMSQVQELREELIEGRPGTQRSPHIVNVSTLVINSDNGSIIN